MQQITARTPLRPVVEKDLAVAAIHLAIRSLANLEKRRGQRREEQRKDTVSAVPRILGEQGRCSKRSKPLVRQRGHDMILHRNGPFIEDCNQW